jgi:hypothetical protein
MFSIVMPLDSNRLVQFRETKRVYDGFPQKKEFLLPTRELNKVAPYLARHHLMKDVRILPYKNEVGFNPSMALNLGTRAATYYHVIITSPEVKPETPVLEQLASLLGKNVLCQVSDQNETGAIDTVLVSRGYRDDTPAMYFLALFNIADIEAINGWDEEFMKGYAYEDNDFGARWVRAGLPFEVHDEIKAVHQYHPRSETIPGGATTNYNQWQENNAKGIIRCTRGLYGIE